MKPKLTRLSRETVLQGALSLLDEVGLDEFTTRRLADRLGIQSPTLYWHFKNKQALLGAMALAMLIEHDAQPVPQPGDDWRAYCRGNAHSFRKALLSHRDGARVHAGTSPTPDQLLKTEAFVALLQSGGFSLVEAGTVILTISRLVVGWVSEEQAASEKSQNGLFHFNLSPERFPLLSEALILMKNQNPNAVFDSALSLLINLLHPQKAD